MAGLLGELAGGHALAAVRVERVEQPNRKGARSPMPVEAGMSATVLMKIGGSMARNLRHSRAMLFSISSIAFTCSVRE